MRRLLIRPGGIGDCLTCFPAMKWLKAEYTEIWVPSNVVPLVQFADRVRAIPDTGIDLLGIGSGEATDGLREALSSFDEIVSWYGTNRPEFCESATALNPCWRFLPALPPERYNGHATDFHAESVGAPYGLQPEIHITNTEPRNTVVIQPFSGSRRKNWPLSRFQELAQLLPVPVEWTAGPEEGLADAHRFENLLALASWIADAAVYIGNDSGISHLAAAAGAPVIALFGASNYLNWQPRGKHVTVIVRASLEEIHVADVLETAMKALR
jgi:ADP-heptose:LPS heptosyltransferase